MKKESASEESRHVPLPPPNATRDVSLHEAIRLRRSVREFAPHEIPEEEVSRLLWAAQGVTSPEGMRAAPSAGALFPLELYVVRPRGASRYLPKEHALEMLTDRDLRGPLSKASYSQDCVRSAAMVVVITGVFKRLRRRYHERAELYTILEAGHAAQNMHLTAVALGLGSVAVGAFNEQAIAELLKLEPGQQSLYIVCVGRPKRAER